MAFLFKRIHLEITNVCNLQCSFCPEVHREKSRMAVDQFRDYLREVKPHTETICLHLMGEPMAHPHFGEILEVCDQEAVRVDLVTNGLLLFKWKDELKASTSLRQLNFSVQSFIDNHPQKSQADYLLKLTSFSQELALTHPQLYINYRFWDLGSPRAGQGVADISKAYGSPQPDLVYCKRMKSVPLEGRHYLHFDSRFEWPSLEAAFQSRQGFCYALRNHVGVLADGQVVPCCFDSQGQMGLGRLGEKSFLEILRSEKAQNIYQGFSDGERKEKLCQHCDYANRFSERTRQRALHREGRGTEASKESGKRL